MVQMGSDHKHWAPQVGSGQRSPFENRGEGPAGQEGMLIMNGTEMGQRVVEVNGVLDDRPQWVRLTAMDFGEVPPSCVLGRDVEKYNRHQRQLFQVIHLEQLADKTRLTLDRAVHVAIPADAQATLTPVELITGTKIENLHLQAECPEAQESQFVQVACTNPEVLDDGGILSLYTDGTQIESVSGQGFGKFTIEIEIACAIAFQSVPWTTRLPMEWWPRLWCSSDRCKSDCNRRTPRQ